MKGIIRFIQPNKGFLPALLLMALLPGTCSRSLAQQSFFQRSYGNAGADICFTVRQLPDSMLYLFGYSENGPSGGYDYALMKLSPAGDSLWTKYYGTPAVDFGLYMDNTRDNGLILIGTTQNPVSGFADDVLLIRVDSAGQELWRRQMGGTGNDVCRYVEETPDGGFICCGITPDNFSSNDAWVIKTDSSGQIEWSNTFGGNDNDVAARVLALSTDTCVVTCDTRSIGSGGYDVQLIGIDEVGNPIFTHVHGDALQNGCQGMMLTSRQRLVSYGETEVYPNSPFDFLLHIYDREGNFLNERTFGGVGAEALFDMTEAPNGDWLGTGYSNSHTGGALPIDLALIRLDSLGNLIWQRNYGGGGIDIGYSVIPALAGGYYIAGRTTLADDQMLLLYVSENGLTALNEPHTENRTGLWVYPQPATLSLTVRSPYPVAGWRIFELSGKLITEVAGHLQSSASLEIQNLTAGIYILEAQGISNVSRIRFVVSQP